MSMTKYSVVAAVLLLSAGCSKVEYSENTSVSEDNESGYTGHLHLSGEQVWRLDSLTDPVFNSSYYDSADSIFYYNNDGTLIKCSSGDSCAVRTEGHYDLACIHVKGDTVWGVNYLNKELREYVAGKETWRKRIDSDADYPPLPRTGISPMTVNDSSISFFGSIAGETTKETHTNRPVLTIYDRNKKTFSNSICYPEIYHSANWGGGMMRWPYAAYNPTSDMFVVGFPASHEIELWKSGKEMVSKRYAGSRKIERIKSFPRSKLMPISTEEILDYIGKTDSYANLFYDSWNDVYYRIAEFALPDGKRFEAGDKKRISVIILDSGFKKIGETDIPDAGRDYRYASYVCHDGLMIPKDTVEDFLAYYKYKLIRER